MSADAWYTYDPEQGFEIHSSAEDARRDAENIIQEYRDMGWHDDIKQISWGRLENHRAKLAEAEARAERAECNLAEAWLEGFAASKEGTLPPSDCTFGERVRYAREARELKLREAAGKLGISPAYLSRIENNKEERSPAEKVIQAMAALYQEDFDELMRLARRVAADIKSMIIDDPKLWRFLRRVQRESLTGEELLTMLDKTAALRGTDE